MVAPAVLAMAGTAMAGSGGAAAATGGSGMAGSQMGAAGIQAGGSLISGILNFWATERTNKKNYDLAMLQRKDTLAAQKQANTLANKNFALNSQQQAFSEEQTNLTRAENTEQKGYNRLQSAYQRAADMLTKQLNMNQSAGSPFQKYAGGR